MGQKSKFRVATPASPFSPRNCQFQTYHRDPRSRDPRSFSHRKTFPKSLQELSKITPILMNSLGKSAMTGDPRFLGQRAYYQKRGQNLSKCHFLFHPFLFFHFNIPLFRLFCVHNLFQNLSKIVPNYRVFMCSIVDSCRQNYHP